MGTVSQNLQRLMAAVEGMNPTKLARETGVPQPTIWKVLNDKIQDPGTDVLAPLAQRFRVSIAMLRGEEPIPDAVAEDVPAYGAVVTLRIYGAEGSMGAGRFAESQDTVVGAMQVSQEWLRRNVPAVSSPKNLAVITAHGDSMEPTFRDGDILLVDRSVNDVKIDAVFVLSRADTLFVKRLQRRLNGDLVIRSDNPLFESETVPSGQLADVRVLGRVLYAWNGRRL
jgi:phage repressor protein C with HTH and peptisase S24 domain